MDPDSEDGPFHPDQTHESSEDLMQRMMNELISIYEVLWMNLMNSTREFIETEKNDDTGVSATVIAVYDILRVMSSYY